MRIKTAIVILIYLIAGAQFYVSGQEGVPENGAASAIVAGESDATRELRIYRDALLRGSSDSIRLDAAITLLLREDSEARAAVLEILNSSEAPVQARTAVCRGLVQSNAALRNKQDFLEPLMGMMVNEQNDLAPAAAQALTIFDYEIVGPRLETLIRGDGLAKSVRLNALYGLQLRPEKEAVSVLIALLDNPDAEIAAAAERALQEMFGYPVGTDKQIWRSILRDLPQKSRGEIMKDRLASQLRQINELKEERDFWQNQYLASLEKEYEKSDEVGRGQLVLEKLGAGRSVVKLWALEKVAKRSGATIFPEDKIRPALLGLVSDTDDRVRLLTAQVLSKMSEINPGEKLLEQLQNETNEAVRVALFEALGEATYFAFSPGSKIKPDVDVRNQTLFWAKRFLNSAEPSKIVMGAVVMRKLLELNGFTPEQMGEYLGLLADRYTKVADHEVRGQILNETARLCGHGGAMKAESSRLYRPLFIAALGSEHAAEQRAAVLGLTNIDKLMALDEIRKANLMETANPSLRLTVIELIGEIGGEKELEWLSGLGIQNGEGDLFRQTLEKILLRQGSQVIVKWVPRLQERIGAERAERLLLSAEKKAENEKDVASLSGVREKLGDFYLSQGQPEKAKSYYNSALANVKDPVRRVEITNKLFDAALKSNDVELALTLIQERLGDGDISIDDGILVYLDAYFNMPEVPLEQKLALIDQFGGAGDMSGKTMWAEKVNEWQGIAANQGTVKPNP